MSPPSLHRTALVALLQAYVRHRPWTAGVPWDVAREEAVAESIAAFVEATPDCLERTSPAGHLTGSALVVDSTLTRVLLTHHAKLDRWLQLGGHADGAYPLHDVALQEAREESGLTRLRLLDVLSGPTPPVEAPLPFDLDIHEIPARGDVPTHLHLDVRYLVVAEVGEPLVISHESHDLRWLDLDAARGLTDEPSMRRQFDKVDWLRARAAVAPNRPA